MPWVNEDPIKGTCGTYEDKFYKVKMEIIPNIHKHSIYFEKYSDKDPDDLSIYSCSESKSAKHENDFGVIHPDLIDLKYNGKNSNNNTVLNQLEFFNSLSKHAIECELAAKNGLDKLDQFRIFLSDGAGIGKRFLVKLATELLKKILKQSGQDVENKPFVLATASTGKASANIDGTTQHLAFMLLIYCKGRFNEKFSIYVANIL